MKTFRVREPVVLAFTGIYLKIPLSGQHRRSEKEDEIFWEQLRASWPTDITAACRLTGDHLFCNSSEQDLNIPEPTSKIHWILPITSFGIETSLNARRLLNSTGLYGVLTELVYFIKLSGWPPSNHLCGHVPHAIWKLITPQESSWTVDNSSHWNFSI